MHITAYELEAWAFFEIQSSSAAREMEYQAVESLGLGMVTIIFLPNASNPANRYLLIELDGCPVRIGLGSNPREAWSAMRELYPNLWTQNEELDSEEASDVEIKIREARDRNLVIDLPTPEAEELAHSLLQSTLLHSGLVHGTQEFEMRVH